MCTEEKIPEQIRSQLHAVSLTEAIADADFELSDVFNLSSTPKRNIGDVLIHLKNKYFPKTVHIFVDEIPCETYSTEYSKELSKCLKEHFENSTVAFSLQSVEKKREIVHDGKIKSPPILDFESTGMTLLRLTKTMRMSSTLHDLKRILEKQIEANSYSIPLEMKKKKEEGEIGNMICLDLPNNVL